VQDLNGFRHDLLPHFGRCAHSGRAGGVSPLSQTTTLAVGKPIPGERGASAPCPNLSSRDRDSPSVPAHRPLLQYALGYPATRRGGSPPRAGRVFGHQRRTQGWILGPPAAPQAPGQRIGITSAATNTAMAIGSVAMTFQKGAVASLAGSIRLALTTNR
jgi:hypothetical protein